MRLRYLIGKDADPGTDDSITVIGYDATTPPKNGVKYVNLLDERGTRQFGPYLPDNDMTDQYGEPVPDPKGEGFWRNLRQQLDLAVKQGFKTVELDNLDSFDASVALLCFNDVQSRGLKTLVKNPALVNGNSAALMKHPAAAGVIIEKGAGSPAEMQAIRSGLPVWFVSYGDGRNWAQQVAQQITANNFQGMGVTYSSNGEYASSEDVLLPSAANTNPSFAMPAPWMNDVRAAKGKYTDGPDVPMLARQIAQAFPDDTGLAGYVALAGNSTAWCGIFCAWALSRYGIKPPHKDNGTGGFMWVDSWKDFGTSVARGQEQAGDLALWLGDPHHISFVAGNGKYIGGNQSNGVTEATFRAPDVIRRPPAPSGDVIVPPTRPMLMLGSVGPEVMELQRLLGGIAVDGEFGPDTESAVRLYQTIYSLEVDGIVGPETWAALLKKPPVDSGGVDLSPDLIGKITSLAATSPLASYSWRDRGKAPAGYIKGMAVTFARCLRKLKAGDSAALAMTVPIGGAKDALALYDINETDRVAILRKLFVLLYGLGMRESSGNCFEGRDMSASNTSADTAEAGLFQQSWNSRAASSELPKLFALYSGATPPDGYLSIFREGVTTKQTDNVGTGDGVTFQALCKSHPAFAVEAAAIGLRVLYNHWGPIIRKEAEMRSEADALLRNVEQIVSIVPKPDPEPIPDQVPDDPVRPPPATIDEAIARIDAAVAELKELRRMTQQAPAAPQIDWAAILAPLAKEVLPKLLPTLLPYIIQLLPSLLPLLLQSRQSQSSATNNPAVIGAGAGGIGAIIGALATAFFGGR